MNIKLLTENAKIPTQGSEYAAGYDLYTTEKYELKPGERKAFKTGISLAIPKGLYGRVAPRSGLAVKHGIDVLAGVIDSDYRGEILVALINFGQEPVSLPIVKDGKETPIAQIIFEKYTNHTFTAVDSLETTIRGEGGFGSTDKKSVSAIDAKNQMSEIERLYNEINANSPNIKKYTDIIKEREQQFK